MNKELFSKIILIALIVGAITSLFALISEVQAWNAELRFTVLPLAAGITAWITAKLVLSQHKK
ncbi:hypothetical protein ACFQ3L_07345 [Lacticaseibacillus jixianensis]|uniref:Holin n=1 Tax=Lacticaseibacillus jixianensis TaxID=2486012 RepID=A0ABW4B9I7_9LACO|nr:hypothetical protein [Lacticaseibacillus jixianensis]